MNHALWPLYLACVASAGTASATPDDVKAAKRGGRAPTEWDWAVVAEPLDVWDGVSTAVEVQKRISNDLLRPTSLALAYWGVHHTASGTSESTQRGDEGGNESDVYDLRSVTVRLKLYVLKPFYLNFGAGVLTTSTKESVTFADGDTVNASKSAVTAGADVGLGHRWVLPHGIVLGGNWLEVYQPIATLQSKDATVPPGYHMGKARSLGSLFSGGSPSAKSDATLTQLRLAVFDLGYAF
jgi:hypothetical protein